MAASTFVDIDTLDEYVSALLQPAQPAPPGSMVLMALPKEDGEADSATPPDADAQLCHALLHEVAHILAERLWGPEHTWRLDRLTVDSWHALVARFKATGWVPCAASVCGADSHVCAQGFSAACPGYELWQPDDVPLHTTGGLQALHPGVQPWLSAHLLVWFKPHYH